MYILLFLVFLLKTFHLFWDWKNVEEEKKVAFITQKMQNMHSKTMKKPHRQWTMVAPSSREYLLMRRGYAEVYFFLLLIFFV